MTGFNFGIDVLYVPSADHDLLSSHVEQQLGIRRDSLLLEQAGVRQIWNNRRRERGGEFRDTTSISRFVKNFEEFHSRLFLPFPASSCCVSRFPRSEKRRM